MYGANKECWRCHGVTKREAWEGRKGKVEVQESAEQEIKNLYGDREGKTRRLEIELLSGEL